MTDEPETLPKTFDPAAIETRWYAHWESQGLFRPDRPDAAPFTIVNPPPNVTGVLHIGHALDNTLQDVMVRYERLRGKDALWVVGMDHAGIATQMVVERGMAAQGEKRTDLSREDFLARVWAWKDDSGGQITRQLRRLGCSMDWSREQFTMDPHFSKAVTHVFVEMHKRGLIYRDKRLVNWDPALKTAISDLEVETREVQGKFWHFQYPLADGARTADGKDHIVVATTRPETMLADMLVAVHPSDERYSSLVAAGAEVELPITGRRVRVIHDDHADPELGSGAVKITPGHDFNDFEVGRRAGIAAGDMLNMFDAEAKVVQVSDGAIPEELLGMDRFEARKRVVAMMDALGLLGETEDRVIQTPYGDRGGVVIEPWLTDQWYVDAEKLAGPAMDAVRSGAVEIVPKAWEKTFFNWMENIQPWCVSRQLWWGHRIPAWYGPKIGDGYIAKSAPDPENPFNARGELEVFVAESEEQAVRIASERYRERNALLEGMQVSVVRDQGELWNSMLPSIFRDSDVLDTWFSSALWPFATLGWPDQATPPPPSAVPLPGGAGEDKLSSPSQDGEGDHAQHGGGVPYKLPPKTNEAVIRAKAMRRNMPPSETTLWQALKDRPGGFKFRRQHPAGDYVLDFFCPAAALAIEVDGEAHDRGDRPERDQRRDAFLLECGVETLRVPAREVFADADAVVAGIVERVKSRLPLHQPAAGPPPRRAGEDLLEKHYPNDLLISGFDILFFWDARMLMQGIEFMGTPPWKRLYLHGLVRAADGSKMSKSKGNTVDPLGLIDRYGADALRFFMAAMESQGRDIKMDEGRVEGYRNFATKLWNAARFCQANGIGASDTVAAPDAKLAVNKWIVGEVTETVARLERALADLRFDAAADAIYHFVWDRFCDWYLELVKPLLNQSSPSSDGEGDHPQDGGGVFREVRNTPPPPPAVPLPGEAGEDLEETRAVAGWALDQILVMLHPFMPFVTEELWHAMGARGDHPLITARWCDTGAAVDEEAKAETEWLIRFLHAVRSARAELNIPPGARVDILVHNDIKFDGLKVVGGPRTDLIDRFRSNSAVLARLGRFDVVEFARSGTAFDLKTGENLDRTKYQSGKMTAFEVVVDDTTYSIPLEGVIDLDAERARLGKAREAALKERDSLAKRLGNPQFLEKAKPEAVAKARADHDDKAAEAERLEAALARLG
ncbi:valine--tRNA ligase [Novosphingopyxis sp.]|uniref:valine--tRNA ligase n=1 Tax=Novosphingopyxis sp. TaxID=2709690 RepID=UPI003B5AEC6F